jgi:hypothetical protein
LRGVLDSQHQDHLVMKSGTTRNHYDQEKAKEFKVLINYFW